MGGANGGGDQDKVVVGVGSSSGGGGGAYKQKKVGKIGDNRKSLDYWVSKKSFVFLFLKGIILFW